MVTESPHESSHQALRRYWPQEFTKRRVFNRQDENRPYIEYIKSLQVLFDNANEDEEEDGEDDDTEDRDESSENVDEDEDEDGDEDEVDKHGGMNEIQDENRIDAKDVTSCTKHGTVKLFMKGVEGEEDALQYLDQVEQVASFCAPQSFKDLAKHVALLNDSNGIAIPGKMRECGPYQGPLTAQQLRDELSKEVAKFSFSNDISRDTDIVKRYMPESDEKTSKNGSGDVGSKAGQRVL
jgi:hypothetical protein